MQAFVNNVGAIYKKIQDGVLDVTNEVTFNLKPTFALLRKM
jgi:hypothetical protein